jgi:hypothetical protein
MFNKALPHHHRIPLLPRQQSPLLLDINPTFPSTSLASSTCTLASIPTTIALPLSLIAAVATYGLTCTGLRCPFAIHVIRAYVKQSNVIASVTKQSATLTDCKSDGQTSVLGDL